MSRAAGSILLRKPLPPFLILVGICLRVWFGVLADVPRFEIDHLHIVAWQKKILQDGLLHVYGGSEGLFGDFQLTSTGTAALDDGSSGRQFLSTEESSELPEHILVIRPNYPPACMLVVAVSALLHRAMDPSMGARTPSARLSILLPTALFDLAIAAGCACVVLRMGGSRSRANHCFAWLWCGPTFWLEFATIGQIDSWVCAWVVLAWLSLLQGRFALGGMLSGFALLTKLQGGVALLVACCALLWAQHGRGQRGAGGARAAWSFGASLCLTWIAVVTPFQWATGWRWLDLSVALNLWRHPTADMTSWYAANVWLVFETLTGKTDASEAFWGFSLHAFGVLLFCGLAVAPLLGWWGRCGASPGGWAVFVVLVTLIGFLTLTRMTDRYILFPVPFMAVLGALGVPSWARWGNVWLNLVAGAHMGRTLWWGDPNCLTRVQDPFTIGLSLLLFAAVAAGTLVIAWKSSGNEAESALDEHGTWQGERA